MGRGKWGLVERELHFRVIRKILSEDRSGKLILKDDKVQPVQTWAEPSG